MMMLKRCRFVLASLMGLALYVSTAVAEPQDLDFTGCRSSTSTILSATKELVVLSFDLKGIDRSNHENKLFDNFSHNCNGVYMVAGEKTSGNGFCKYMAPDGDFTVLEWKNTGTRGKGTWTFLHGTGKFKGITGGGDYDTVARAKPIVKGTVQTCIRVTGTMDLPQ